MEIPPTEAILGISFQSVCLLVSVQMVQGWEFQPLLILCSIPGDRWAPDLKYHIYSGAVTTGGKIPPVCGRTNCLFFFHPNMTFPPRSSLFNKHSTGFMLVLFIWFCFVFSVVNVGTTDNNKSVFLAADFSVKSLLVPFQWSRLGASRTRFPTAERSACRCGSHGGWNEAGGRCPSVPGTAAAVSRRGPGPGAVRASIPHREPLPVTPHWGTVCSALLLSVF